MTHAPEQPAVVVGVDGTTGSRAAIRLAVLRKAPCPVLVVPEAG